MTTVTALLGGETVSIKIGVDYPPDNTLLGLDIESTYMGDQGQWAPDFKVRLVQFATRGTAWVYDPADPRQRVQIVEILNDSTRTFCSHTDMDVMAVWREFGIDIAERNLDTRMLAIEARPDADWGNDLKTLATAYGMPELEAAEAVLHTHFLALWTAQGGKKNAKRADVHALGWSQIDVADPSFLEYAALDAVACRRLAELLVPATQNPPEVLAVDQWLHVRAAHSRMAGKRVDTDRLAEMLAEARLVAGTAKSKAMDLTNGVNPAGPKIIDWLGEHGVDWSRWEGPVTDGGKPSLAKEAISLVLDHPVDDVAREVVEQIKIFKSWTDILNKTEEINRRMVDGRIHPLLNPVGAGTTARMSASGPNMQNFSKRDPRLRGLFLPEEGHTLMTIDFAQVELRVVAALAREEKMIEVILAGGDLHQLTVDLLRDGYGIEITRDTGKMSNFLIVYGGGGKALHEQAVIPLDQSFEIVRAQRQAYPSISALTQYLGMEREAIRTVSHRRLPVTTNKKSGDIRAYANVNYAVQSAARELLVHGWKRLESRHPGVVWWPIHDELVLQVPDDQLDVVAADAEWAMTFDFRGVPIEADAVVLQDENGVSRWMTGKRAEQIAKQKEQVAA